MIAASEQPDGWWSVSFKYDPYIVSTIKEVPYYGRSYSPDQKTWTIRNDFWTSSAQKLRADGYTVLETPLKRQQQSSVNDAWASALFNRLPQQMHDAAWKALMTVCHPDKGGDTLITQELNNARDRAKKK